MIDLIFPRFEPYYELYAVILVIGALVYVVTKPTTNDRRSIFRYRKIVGTATVLAVGLIFCYEYLVYSRITNDIADGRFKQEIGRVNSIYQSPGASSAVLYIDEQQFFISHWGVRKSLCSNDILSLNIGAKIEFIHTRGCILSWRRIDT